MEPKNHTKSSKTQGNQRVLVDFGGIQTPKSGEPPSKHKVFKAFSQGEPSILCEFWVKIWNISRILGRFSHSQEGRKYFRQFLRKISREDFSMENFPTLLVSRSVGRAGRPASRPVNQSWWVTRAPGEGVTDCGAWQEGAPRHYVQRPGNVDRGGITRFKLSPGRPNA